MSYGWNDQEQPQPASPEADPPSEEDINEQWFFQFNEHLLLTVQAIHRLREALMERMP